LINLQTIIGFGCQLHETRLKFEKEVSQVVPDYRCLSELEAIVLDCEWYVDASKNLSLYGMYRNLFKLQHQKTFQSIRFDITVIPPLCLGQELVKTAGHYHSIAATGLHYPEIYQVAHGTAHYLLQKPKHEWTQLEDVVLINAVAGDVVVIPPGYGHITINPGDDPLVMANLVARSTVSDYEPIKQLHGGAYFETKDHQFLKNEHYEYVPELRRVKPPNTFESLKKGMSIYTSYIHDPSALNCLETPNKQIFEGILS